MFDFISLAYSYWKSNNNLISKCLSQNVYPKKMKVTKDQAEKIMKDFHFENHFPGCCRIFYTTKKGHQKSCLIQWKVDWDFE